MSVTVPRTNTLVIYHGNCVDGACAAWCAWKRYGETAEYRPWNYGTPAPTDEEVEGREVVIVDFSFARAELERIHGKAKSLLVLDHHKSAQEDLGDLLYAVFDMEKSGARLALEHCIDMLRPSILYPAQKVVDYVEDRDFWRWKLPDSKEISAAIDTFGVTEDFRRFEEVQKALESPAGYEMLVATGKALLRYQDEIVKIALTRRMMGRLGGYELPIVNATTLLSETAGALAEDSPHGVGAAWFVRGDGKLQVSLRVRAEGAGTGRVRGDSDFDASVLAKRFVGGGHKKAAGFESDLPWRELFMIEGR